MTQTPHIIELLKTSFLVSEASKQEILEKLSSLSGDALQKMEMLLEEAEKKQYEFLAEAVKNNPALVNELEEIYRKGMKEQRETQEKNVKTEEAKILEMLEGNFK